MLCAPAQPRQQKPWFYSKLRGGGTVQIHPQLHCLTIFILESNITPRIKVKNTAHVKHFMNSVEKIQIISSPC